MVVIVGKNLPLIISEGKLVQNAKQTLDPPPPKPPFDLEPSNMDDSDLEISLEDTFKAGMALKGKEEVMELPANEKNNFGDRMLALLAKPHGFRTPPTKVVAAHLQFT